MNESRNVEAVDSRRPVAELLEDLGAKLRRHPLVGVEIEHPLEARLVERELLLLAVFGPVADEDAVGERAHDVERPVRRMRVDDDDLVAPIDALEAGADVVLLVEADDD